MANDYSKTATNYGKSGVSGVYYLAVRDLPDLLRRHADGHRVLDYGCGNGRSTRFLKDNGYLVTGVDIGKEMIENARKLDPTGEYALLDAPALAGFDAVVSVAVFLEMSSHEEISAALAYLKKAVTNGPIIIVTSSEEHFTSRLLNVEYELPKGRPLIPGERVKLHLKNENIDIYDYYWPDSEYRIAFKKAGLRLIEVKQPLATGKEPWPWKDELTKPPWTIYVLRE